MTSPMHTPYDGLAKPFTIGLKSLDLADWIDVDDQLLRYLDEKDRIAATAPHDFFAAEPNTDAAQAEVLSLLTAHLPQHFPDIYSYSGPAIDIVPAFRRIALESALPPLLIAAGLVQEDLILMRKDAEDWRLVAGALAFPSSWNLRDKLGLPMHDVHAPVPGFNAGMRPAKMIARIFDNLQPEQPVVRWNWSLYGDDTLPHPPSDATRRFGEGEVAEHVFLRLERQTLRKLPQSGDILFTIRIYIDPLEALSQRPDGSDLARAIAEHLRDMTPQQLAYKGLTDDRDRLMKRLLQIT